MVIKSSLNDEKFNCSSGIRKRFYVYIHAVNGIHKCFNNKRLLAKLLILDWEKITVKGLILKIVNKINAANQFLNFRHEV